MDNLTLNKQIKSSSILSTEDSIRFHITKYLRYLMNKNRSPQTVKTYSRYFDIFLNDCPHVQKVTDITIPTVIDFQDKLFLKGLSESSRNGILVAIRSFLMYCARMELPVINPAAVELPHVSKQETVYLDSDEIKLLLKSVASNGGAATKLEVRDRAIMELLLSSGLRVSELCNLKTADIDLQAQEVRVISGKGGKHRLTFMSRSAVSFITAYLKNKEESEYLFTSSMGKRGTDKINPRTIQRVVVYYSKQAGIKKPVTVHTLRHAFATQMLSRGLDLREVQELLGHANIQMTTRYTHISNPGLKRSYMRALSPFALRTDGTVENEKVVVSKESLTKLFGSVGKTIQQNNQILKKLK